MWLYSVLAWVLLPFIFVIGLWLLIMFIVKMEILKETGFKISFKTLLKSLWLYIQGKEIESRLELLKEIPDEKEKEGEESC